MSLQGRRDYFKQTTVLSSQAMYTLSDAAANTSRTEGDSKQPCVILVHCTLVQNQIVTRSVSEGISTR
jgi:hypothetical protein